MTTVVFNPFTGNFDYVSCGDNSPIDKVISQYSEQLSVPSSTSTLIGTYTATENILLQKIDFSGTNTAEYVLLVDGDIIEKKRTYFGGTLNDLFNFKDGLPIGTGQVIEIYVIHYRPYAGDFNSRFQLAELE